ncbi:YdbL family protein [Arsukibacterium sp.]|uniref:YdbL family protein n=1 Tax=Arsukibacterium sp. TaxID=1977258 RepID=UPI00299F4A8B|nr:YdbL family protein [Arsukibacterium sp.]MDX1538693.1 YdbL family protein [Arsukibacterium sp.]
MKLTKFRLLLAGLLLALSLPVMAMNLQQAMAALSETKSQGLVGEQPNGYLGVVQSTERSEAVVKLINDARRAEYTRLARQNDIAVADVEAIAGQKALEKTALGHFILIDGNWVRKR